MYRHFALITVALTAGIAMFANGENSEAAAAQPEEQARQQVLEQEGREILGATKVGQTAAATPRRRGFADDHEVFGGGFGQPMVQPSAQRVASLAGQVVAAGSYGGYSEAYLASLSEEERARLLAGLEKEGLLSPHDRERRALSLVVASARRSGSAPSRE